MFLVAQTGILLSNVLVRGLTGKTHTMNDVPLRLSVREFKKQLVEKSQYDLGNEDEFRLLHLGKQLQDGCGPYYLD